LIARAALRPSAIAHVHVLGLLEPVDVGDVGMVQRRKCFGFTLKSSESRSIGRECFGQNLDGDIPIEPCVACAIDLAHSARADGGKDLVRAEACPWCQSHLIRQSIILMPAC
jgi:hypothetical protein